MYQPSERVGIFGWYLLGPLWDQRLVLFWEGLFCQILSGRGFSGCFLSSVPLRLLEDFFFLKRLTCLSCLHSGKRRKGKKMEEDITSMGRIIGLSRRSLLSRYSALYASCSLIGVGGEPISYFRLSHDFLMRQHLLLKHSVSSSC
jgi:hypothetical protein